MRARGGRSAREERGSGKRRRQRERWGIDRLGFGLGGPRGWAFGRRLQDGPAWEAGWALSLPYFFGRKEIEKRKRKRGLEKEFAHANNFPGLTKMRLIQEK